MTRHLLKPVTWSLTAVLASVAVWTLAYALASWGRLIALQDLQTAYWYSVFVVAAGGAMFSPWFWLSDIESWRASTVPWRKVVLGLGGCFVCLWWFGSVAWYILKGQGWMQ